MLLFLETPLSLPRLCSRGHLSSVPPSSTSGKAHFHFLREQKLVTSRRQPGQGKPEEPQEGQPSLPFGILSRLGGGRLGPCDSGAGGSKALSGEGRCSSKQREAGSVSAQESQPPGMCTVWRCHTGGSIYVEGGGQRSGSQMARSLLAHLVT